MINKRILIIDDEVDIANNIKAILKDENYDTSIAHNSSDAFRYLSENKYNLIILDVWLDNSELDGFGAISLKKVMINGAIKEKEHVVHYADSLNSLIILISI